MSWAYQPLLPAAAQLLSGGPVSVAATGSSATCSVGTVSTSPYTLTSAYNDIVDPASSTTPNAVCPTTVAGDIIVMQISWASVSRGPPSWPSGFTLVEEADSDNPGFLPDTCWWATKTAAGTEGGTTLTATLSGATDWSCGLHVIHANAGTLSLAHHASLGKYYGSTGSITMNGPASVPVDTTGDLVGWLVAISSSGSANGTSTITPPSGFAFISDIGDVWEERMASYTKSETAGSYTYDGSATFTASNGKVSHVGVFVFTTSNIVAASGSQATTSVGTVGTTGGSLTVSATGSQATTSVGTVGTTGGSVGGSFATFDATRKGTASSLSGSNLIATMTNQVIVCATDTVDIKSATFYWEIADTTLGDYIGMGLALSSVSNFNDYLGDASGQLAWWSDGTYNNAMGVTVAGNPPVCSASDKRKFALVGNGTNAKLYIGIVGTGWWNATAGNYTANPDTATAPWASAITGTMSPAVSAFDASTNVATANFGATAFGDTPPTVCTSNGWPVAGGAPVTVAATGSSATTSVGTVVPKLLVAASGSSATGSVGTVVAKVWPASQTATTAQGTVGVKIAPAASGSSASGVLGTIGDAMAVAANGLAAAASIGTVALLMAAAVAGSSATASAGTVTPNTGSGANATGSQATASVGTVGVAIGIPATGTAATSASGTVPAKLAPAVSGSAATASTGTVGDALAVAATGSSATSAQGTAGPLFPVPVSGSQATSATGTVALRFAVGASGSQAATSEGTAAPGVSVPATGVQAASATGTVADAIAVALSGTGASSAIGIVATVSGSTVSVNGSSATASEGTVGAAFSLPAAGSAASSAIGTVGTTQQVTAAATGSSAATAIGTVLPLFQVQITGTQAAAAQGALAPLISVSVNGQEMTAIAGRLPGERINYKLVSFTATNIGSVCGPVATASTVICTLTATNIGSVCTLTVTDLD